MPPNRKKLETAALRIEGEMTIYRAAELKQLLLAPLDHPIALKVDLSKVTEIDTAGVQLLMLARREALSAQRPLQLLAPSPAVAQAMDLLGLASYFGEALLAAPGQSGKDMP